MILYSSIGSWKTSKRESRLMITREYSALCCLRATSAVFDISEAKKKIAKITLNLNREGHDFNSARRSSFYRFYGIFLSID